MAFSSDFGIFIPIVNDNYINILVNNIIGKLDELGSLTKKDSISVDVYGERIERRLIFFKKTTITKRFKNISRSENDFWLNVNEITKHGNHLSMWKVPDYFSSILLNGNAEKKNIQLWTPEDVSISWGEDDFDLGDSVKALKGIKIYIWGYGYYFPYTMDEVISIIIKDKFFRELSMLLNEIEIKYDVFKNIVGDTGQIINLPECRYPIYIEQSL